MPVKLIETATKCRSSVAIPLPRACAATNFQVLVFVGIYSRILDALGHVEYASVKCTTGEQATERV